MRDIKTCNLRKRCHFNSAYGAMGSKYFRFYDLRMAVAITLAGQLSIQWIEAKFNQYMNKLLGTDGVDYVIASDTDSLYIRFGPIIDKFYSNLPVEKVIDIMDKICQDKFQPFIDQSFQELADHVNAYKQKMKMKREGLSNKGIWTAKKHYILNVYDNEGVRYNEPHLKVMGLEMVKSSTPLVVRQAMKEIIGVIINQTEKDVQQYVENFREQFKTLPPEDISSPRGCNGIKQYSDSVTLYKKGTPLHVRGAIVYNDSLNKFGVNKKYQIINEGDKIRYTYLMEPNPLKSDIISFPHTLPKELGIHKYVDYNKQFEKTFLTPIQNVLDCIGWKAEHQNSLESFFS